VLAIAFEDEAQGPACLRTVKGLRDQGQLKINDAAVLVEDLGGKVKVNMVESGVKEGALLGKTFINTSLDKRFIADVQDAVKPGNSAVLFIVTHENFDLLITALEPYKGRILQTFFDSETEE
jgi:uncharacterized membrane protein